MKKIIFTILITLQLFAQDIKNSNDTKTPFIYSALGDKIYNNAKNIEKLQDMLEYKAQKDKIKKYIEDVKKTKEMGFKIQNEDKNIDKKAYLEALRKLSKTNDYFVNKINNNLINSIKSNDNILFVNSINSGLVDVSKNKKIIINYYNLNKNDINATGILKKVIQQHNSKASIKGLTKAQLEKIEIQRIRKKDKAQQEAIERSLEEEVIRKKIEIRKMQKKELGIETK